MTDPSQPATSAAIPAHGALRVAIASLAALDATTARTVADRTGRWWHNGDRITRAMLLVPVSGCTAATWLASDFVGAAASLSFLALMMALPAHVIAGEFIARAVREEMRELGFDGPRAREAFVTRPRAPSCADGAS